MFRSSPKVDLLTLTVLAGGRGGRLGTADQRALATGALLTRECEWAGGCTQAAARAALQSAQAAAKELREMDPDPAANAAAFPQLIGFAALVRGQREWSCREAVSGERIHRHREGGVGCRRCCALGYRRVWM
jgi:hypothetical protein